MKQRMQYMFITLKHMKNGLSINISKVIITSKNGDGYLRFKCKSILEKLDDPNKPESMMIIWKICDVL